MSITRARTAGFVRLEYRRPADPMVTRANRQKTLPEKLDDIAEAIGRWQDSLKTIEAGMSVEEKGKFPTRMRRLGEINELASHEIARLDELLEAMKKKYEGEELKQESRKPRSLLVSLKFVLVRVEGCKAGIKEIREATRKPMGRAARRPEPQADEAEAQESQGLVDVGESDAGEMALDLGELGLDTRWRGGRD
ncbi:hypothetical protein ACFL5U_03110 [Candidatus Margulisiibacteriota bacterium]